ncbi:phosphoribosylglycinamide formyltransferase [Ellagibacter isourolithinifaciens]|uniref:phosphoribosylglycinamide formyltransferase n=1 Tax=Ellagibacter isourolithinifaciens TaxID=2137581 RepID=UPI003A937C6C
MAKDSMKLAVFISGTGTNMVAIHNAIKDGALDATIELIVSSNDYAKGIDYARNEGLDLLVFTPADYDDPEAVDARIVEALEEHDIEYVAMAGYMRKVTPVLLDAFPNRVVNLHPALLPKHRGAHAIQDAFEAGDEVTGITIHFANEEYDKGPIIFQHEVPVLPDDTIDDLETRIHAAEHEYYPQVLQQIARGEVQV